MTNQSQKVLDIQRAVGERVKARLPSLLFKALVRHHERTGFRTGCTCKYCNEKRFVSHLVGYGDSIRYYDPTTYELYKRKKSEILRTLARSRLKEVSEKELDDFTKYTARNGSDML